MEFISILFLNFNLYKKSYAKENLEWVKQQNWCLSYKSDPKWEDMLEHDKKMFRILGSYSNKKLINDREIQEILKKELIGHYEMWKIAWKLR